MNFPIDANLDWSGLVVMGLDECLDRLREEPVGRLGLVDHGEPVILPVNYALDGRSIVFRTAHGSKLAAAIMQAPVCFEVDGWDTMDHTGWSVLVKGIADEVLDDGEIARLSELPTRPWSHPDLRVNWVRIMSEEITGRRVA